jgi:hypothetical protein
MPTASNRVAPMFDLQLVFPNLLSYIRSPDAFGWYAVADIGLLGPTQMTDWQTPAPDWPIKRPKNEGRSLEKRHEPARRGKAIHKAMLNGGFQPPLHQTDMRLRNYFSMSARNTL